MKLRALAASTALAMAGTLGGGALLTAVDAAPASAAPVSQAAPSTSGLTQQIPCTMNGVASTCTLKVTALSVVNRTLQASGTVTNGTTTIPFSGVPLDPPAASCPILALTLGPLHLNLLGLVVDLNQVVLNVTAQPGPGNLLGNLLCTVTNLLNNNSSLTAVTQLLNHINSILAGL